MLNRTCRVIHSHHLHKATKTCIYVHVYTYIYIFIYIYYIYIAAPQALHFCTNLPRTISIDITDITSISSKNNASYKNYVFQRKPYSVSFTSSIFINSNLIDVTMALVKTICICNMHPKDTRSFSCQERRRCLH